MPKARGTLAPKRYVCEHPGCSFRTDFSSTFINHQQTAHTSNGAKEASSTAYFCRSCNVKADSKQAWRQHIEGAKHRRAELTLNVNITYLTGDEPMATMPKTGAVMYSTPADIPFDEPAAKKKRKARMMVPDDLGDVVHASSHASTLERPRAFPTAAPEQDFDLEGFLTGSQGMAEGHPRAAPPPPPPPPRAPKPQAEEGAPSAPIRSTQPQAIPLQKQVAKPLLQGQPVSSGSPASTLSPASRVFVPKTTAPQSAVSHSTKGLSPSSRAFVPVSASPANVAAPAKAPPGKPIPGKQAPGKSAPEKAAPKSAAPKQAAPKTTAAAQAPEKGKPAGSSAAPTAAAEKSAVARKVSRPTLGVPWRSKSLEEKKKEAESDSPAQSWSKEALERSDALQRRPSKPPPGFEEGPSKQGATAGNPAWVQAAKQKAASGTAPPGFQEPLQTAGSTPIPKSAKEGQRVRVVSDPAVERLRAHLEASWPAASEAPAPQWVKKKEPADEEQGSLKTRSTWPQAVPAWGAQKLGQVPPPGTSQAALQGPVALGSPAKPPGGGSKGLEKPGEPAAAKPIVRLERPRPPSFAEALAKSNTAGVEQCFDQFFPESTSPAVISPPPIQASAEALLPPEETFKDVVDCRPNDLPPPVDEGGPSSLQLNSLEILHCPITLDVMERPVLLSDGHTYEFAAIIDWLKDKDTSPMTGEPLMHKGVTDNLFVRALIKNLHDTQGSTS